ncbi:MAG: ATP-binding cassette domain-containing protein [Microthrixaceae bacterium]
MPPIISVENLRKSFGETQALAGVSFEVEQGTVLGLLGPNGAGKTTVVRVLATLLRADQGSAKVAGFDVVTDANQVRSIIGLTGQYAAVDEKLTGAENLQMVGRLLGMSSATAKKRSAELLERFDLSEAGTRQVGTYSGGMRRRVDLAVSLVGRPEVLFLDEPTTGLDPASRLELWAITRELVADGTTVLLTTQYLDEADELADRIVVIDAGKVIEEGTADELKDRTGGRSLVIEFATSEQLSAAAQVLDTVTTAGSVHRNEVDRILSVPVEQDTALAARAISEISAAQIPIVDFYLHRPSLDDVFLTLTGYTPGSENSEPAEVQHIDSTSTGALS